MNIPRDVFEKAIRGGWNPPSYWDKESVPLIKDYTVLDANGMRIVLDYLADRPWQVVVLDASFWQSLGKALVWEDCKCLGKCGSVYPEYVNGCVRCGQSVRADEHYLFHSLKFARLVLTGGDTEAYWKELLL